MISSELKYNDFVSFSQNLNKLSSKVKFKKVNTKKKQKIAYDKT